MISSAFEEQVLAFECLQERLWGILCRPLPAARSARTAVLIVVGGPQYRAGSHRQFVQLARGLARAGFISLRFDYRGMGDSEGQRRDFTATESDLRAALDAICAADPRIESVVVWGLCDAASAALMFAAYDHRVAGIVAANPWVRSPAGLAATELRHYYAMRFLQRDFWRKLASGGFDWRASIAALAGNLRNAWSLGAERSDTEARQNFQDAMAAGLAQFAGPVLLILSGSDLTAKEFLQHSASSPRWAGLLDRGQLRRVDLPEADHTFSRQAWLDAANEATIDWLRQLPSCIAAAPLPAAAALAA